MFRYVSLGDSTAVGVGARAGGYPEHLFQKLKQRGVEAGFLNLGESGAVASDVVRQAERAATKRPHLVTLGVGANDSWRGTSATEYQGHLRRIRETLRATGASVVASGLVDFSHSPAAAFAQRTLGLSSGGLAQHVRVLNDALSALAEPPWFTVVDLLAFSQSELPQHPEYFSPDGFHPSDAGYARWAELLWPALERLLPRAP
jgi:acyl-CoA thioesterase-1